MFRKKKKKRPEISAPKNFEHRVHTSFDAKHGCFVGLPTQWQSLIENLRRPKPMVDPSRITEVELRPKKVSRTFSFISIAGVRQLSEVVIRNAELFNARETDA